MSKPVSDINVIPLDCWHLLGKKTYILALQVLNECLNRVTQEWLQVLLLLHQLQSLVHLDHLAREVLLIEEF